MKRRLTCAVLALCLLLSGCAATGTTSPQRYSVTWWDVFDTVTVISGYADSEADWNTQMTALHADLLRYNQLYDIYNHYDGMTNLADVNAGAAAAPVAVGDEIMNLLTFAQEMYQATDGACNAAAGAVLRYWHDARTAAGDGAEVSADILPKTADLQAAAAHCNMDDLILNQNTGTVYFADPELQLDVGSIGKGYAVEQCAQAAEARGLTSALLNVGGNVRAIGTKPNSGPWVAGVDNPGRIRRPIRHRTLCGYRGAAAGAKPCDQRGLPALLYRGRCTLPPPDRPDHPAACPLHEQRCHCKQ